MIHGRAVTVGAPDRTVADLRPVDTGAIAGHKLGVVSARDEILVDPRAVNVSSPDFPASAVSPIDVLVVHCDASRAGGQTCDETQVGAGAVEIGATDVVGRGAHPIDMGAVCRNSARSRDAGNKTLISARPIKVRSPNRARGGVCPEDETPTFSESVGNAPGRDKRLVDASSIEIRSPDSSTEVVGPEDVIFGQGDAVGTRRPSDETQVLATAVKVCGTDSVRRETRPENLGRRSGQLGSEEQGQDGEDPDDERRWCGP